MASIKSTLPHLYRAHIEPRDGRGPERTAFVEAFSHQCACKKIAATIAALEHRQTIEVADRIYNCCSAQELIDEGLSEDLDLRLFETGWSGGKATHFVSEPLFLLERPSDLIRIWAELAGGVQDAEALPGLRLVVTENEEVRL